MESVIFLSNSSNRVPLHLGSSEIMFVWTSQKYFFSGHGALEPCGVTSVGNLVCSPKPKIILSLSILRGRGDHLKLFRMPERGR